MALVESAMLKLIVALDPVIDILTGEVWKMSLLVVLTDNIRILLEPNVLIDQMLAS